MDANQWQAEEFERNRAHLRAVAYRMLGSRTDADDAVQETWIRFARAQSGAVDNLGGWLTTVVSRVCLDMLRARRARHEDLVDVPRVTLDDDTDPEAEALLADSVGLALMVVLEALSPAERLAFVLHDMFGMPFEEIAPIVDRSATAARQLASRARRRVRGVHPESTTQSLASQREVVDAFLAASREGDFEGLLALLDPEVVFRSDRGTDFSPGPIELSGAEQVARVVVARGTPNAPLGRRALVDGQPGAVVVVGGRARAVVKFTIVGDRVMAMDLTVDPETLRRVRV